MATGVLRTASQLKCEELFVRWLAQPAVQASLADEVVALARGTWEPVEPRPAHLRPESPPVNWPLRGSPRRQRSPAAASLITTSGSNVSLTTQRLSGADLQVPPFYGVGGEAEEQELDLIRIVCLRRQGPDGRLPREAFLDVAEVCGLPRYCGPALFAKAQAACPAMSGPDVTAWWASMCGKMGTTAERFVHIMHPAGDGPLAHHHWTPFVECLMDTHPGLAFLADLPEFRSRYCDTVIARLFYTINRSWSGEITAAELQRSRFFEIAQQITSDDDINNASDFFSYEHFYVIYTTFWKLDRDRDLEITREELGEYGDRGLPDSVLDRLFSGHVLWHANPRGTMAYWDFVWFMLSEEDKATPTSVEYWFRVLDADGQGVLTMFQLEELYRGQVPHLSALGCEPLPFGDCICLVLDMVAPRRPHQISQRDLKRCGHSSLFFNTFLNAHKVLEHEERDQFQAAEDREAGIAPQSDWERFAWRQYELLAAEEEQDNSFSGGDSDGGRSVAGDDVLSWLTDK